MRNLLNKVPKVTIINITEISDKEFETALNKLNSKKFERVSKMHNYEDKLRSVCADICARKAVSEFVGTDFDNVTILEDENSKPFYTGIYLSISHSGDYAVCAVDSKPIGIDIEKIRPNLKRRIIKRICKTQDEVDFADCDTFAENIIKIWTAKEACFKALVPQPRFINDVKLSIVNDNFICEGISYINTESFCVDYIITTAFCRKI